MLAKIPQRKPSPPERAAIAGISTEKMEVEDEEDGERDELFLPQQITSCLPLASIAQKNPSKPNAAEIGAIDPNPYAKTKKRCRKTQRGSKNLQDLKRVQPISMISSKLLTVE